MKTGCTRGLFQRTLYGFCLLMALAAQADWEGYPPLQNRYKEHEFLAACREGNCPAVQFYLENDGFNCNEEHNSGLMHKPVTGLYIASQEGHTEAVRSLIAAGADLDRSALGGTTSLYIASQNGHAQVARMLIAAGADIDCSCSNGATSLSIASRKGHTKVVSTLIAAGADIDRGCNDGATPLLIASYKGYTEAVSTLIAAGADIDRCCSEGATPLFVASQNGHTKIVKNLIAAGADIDRSWRARVTPLSIASQQGHTKVVSTLVAAGADVDRSCPEGATSLFMASRKGHAEVVRILVEAGANPSIEWRVSGPLCLAVDRSAPLDQAKFWKWFTLPGSAKRGAYNEIISMLSQAHSHSLPPEKNDTDHQTGAPHLLSTLSRLSLSGKPSYRRTQAL